MNTYVMVEMAALLAVAGVAGILIGWCIKSLLSGRTERQVRENVARDVDDAAADVANIRQALSRKDAQLKDATQELQKMRGRDVSMKAGNTNQVDEINKLKNELALARQSLDRNRTEFNSFRNEKQTEIQQLGNTLSSFQSGGSVHDERMQEANETIGALRTAVRENDKVIDSLRARITEGDSTVENLRNQLKSAESTLTDAQKISENSEASLAKLNSELQLSNTESEKLTRDYTASLENKNKDIGKLQRKIEELGNAQSLLQKKEHEYAKLNTESRETSTRFASQISDLKKQLTEKTSQLAESTKGLKASQDQIKALGTKNQTLTANADRQQTISKQLENKSAEVVALNDMLKDVSNKRTQAQTRVSALEQQLHTVETGKTVPAEIQRKIAGITAMLKERDATIAKLRSDMDEVVDSRNKVSSELGEYQANSEKTKLALTQQADQQLTQMQHALKDRDQSFDKLRNDMDQMSLTRDRLTEELGQLQQRGTQLESFKSDMQSTVAKRDSELQQRKVAYDKLQQEFNQLANTRDDYEKRISALTDEVKAQSLKLQEQQQRSNKEISELQPQIGDLRSRLSLTESENQKLSAELANTASLKLSVTERDATIQKLTVDLQDAKMAGAAGPAHDDALRRVDSLTSALKDRDTEMSRLNSIITDNRLGSKKYQSENTLLKQEIESQRGLIKGLEEQAENTLQLHKKIAAQATDIEDLRARLYENDDAQATVNNAIPQNLPEMTALNAQLQQQKNETATLRNKLAQTQQTLSHTEVKLKNLQPAKSTVSDQQTNDLKTQLAMLQNEVKKRDADIQQLQKNSTGFAQLQQSNSQLQQQIEQRDRELRNARQQLTDTAKNTNNNARINTATAATANHSTAKPRVFVRQNANGSSTEALTGTTSFSTPGRATYTRDGYKLKRTDGGDDLTLLPGIDSNAQRELNNNGVSDFEQITLWEKREIAHFSDRAGIASAEAQRYDWPKLARQILDGSYRKSSFQEKDRS